MIDFKNKSIIKLSAIQNEEGEKIIKNIIIQNEEVIGAFSSMRDKLIFTTKRIIAINVQGLTGSKIDYSSIPYSKIQCFSLETAGILDLDSELDIVISGLGNIRFELKNSPKTLEIYQAISEKILN